MKKEDKILIIGIGNCGREDDGLGWAFLDKIKTFLPNFFDIEYRYQLQVEDASLITQYDKVFFVDAYKKKTENGFFIKEGTPVETHSFTSHALAPETILFLAQSLFNKLPESNIIGISGENFELKIGLTKSANKNLINALDYFLNTIINQPQIIKNKKASIFQ